MHAFALLLGFIWRATAEVPEDESEEAQDANVAATLVGSLVVMMMLHYVTNSRDPDIRRYANEIINSTIGIFCAVLTFQTINEEVRKLVIWISRNDHDHIGLPEMIVRGLLVIVCYSVLQVALAYSSNLFMANVDYERFMATREGQFQTKLNLGTTCTLCAHITGFSVINMWATLQQTEWCRQSRFHAFLVVPLALLSIILLRLLFKSVRFFVARRGLHNTGYTIPLKHWIHNTFEAETDITGLSLSFLIVQVLRFAISGVLPNVEGHETDETLFTHSYFEVMLLFGAGILFVLLATALKFVGKKYELLQEEEEEDEEPSPTVALARVSTAERQERLRQNYNRLMHRGRQSATRVLESSILACSMCFAWCAFYSSKWLIFRITSHKEHSCGLAIIHAYFLSILCFLGIWIKDKMDDCQRRSGDGLAEGVLVGFAWQRLTIYTNGILVGFAWEQSFDVAVAALANEGQKEFHHKSWTKAILAFLCVGIVAPAWRMYLAPMVLDGWRFGFVTHHVIQKARELTDEASGDPRAQAFIVEYGKLLHHLQILHHSPDSEPDMARTSAIFQEGVEQLRQRLQQPTNISLVNVTNVAPSELQGEASTGP